MNKNTTWSDSKMEELNAKGKENWNEDDWDSYNYIMQIRYENGYYAD